MIKKNKAVRILPVVFFFSVFTAAAQIGIPLNQHQGYHDLTIHKTENNVYTLTTTGKAPYIQTENIDVPFDPSRLYYLSFDIKAPARIGALSVSFGNYSAAYSVGTAAIHSVGNYTTVTLNMKDNINWTHGFKQLRINFSSPVGNVIEVKNIVLRQPTVKEVSEEPFYIDNGKIRLGVDMGSGGSVFYFAQSKSRRNLLNHADKGRFIQQSYYGRSDNSFWGIKPWAWNPVQGGGSAESGGSPAKVLASKLSANEIYVKSMPKHWATGQDIADAVMEEHITLNKSVAHIIYTFSYNGNVVHPVKAQELPAVFVDYALKHLIFYQANKPWSNDTLTSVVPGWPNEPQKMTESWAAYTDDAQWGIGIYVPGTTNMTTYRHKGDLITGPYGAACSYLAPVRKFSITPGMVFTYDVYLTIGKIKAIRRIFYKIRKTNNSAIKLN